MKPIPFIRWTGAAVSINRCCGCMLPHLLSPVRLAMIACTAAVPLVCHAAALPVPVATGRTVIGVDRIAQAATVEVFSNSAIYLSNVRDARVYLLDALEVLDRELSAGLPANEREAQAMVRRRLRGMGTAKLADRTRMGAQGIVEAARYGIERIPAVVVNGEAVIYGVTDIDAARAIFQRSQRK